MPRLILLLLVLYALWYGWQYVKSRPPGERKRVIWVWGSVALVVICSILVATGRLHWIAAALAALIPMGQALLRWLPRVFPVLKFMQKKGFAPSTLRTRGLEVTFNLATGETRGRVFEGPFDGHELEALSEEQLREQFAWFQNNDRQSALLLRTYMLKRGFSGFDTAGSERESSSPSRGDLSRGLSDSGAGTRRQPRRYRRGSQAPDPEASPGPGRQRLPGGEDQCCQGYIGQLSGVRYHHYPPAGAPGPASDDRDSSARSRRRDPVATHRTAGQYSTGNPPAGSHRSDRARHPAKS